MGGIGGTLIALAHSPKVDRVVVLRSCKRRDVKHAKKVADSAFLVNPSTMINKKPSLEGQLASKDYETYVVCLDSPWPMVLESVDVVVEGDVVAGDMACLCSPKPPRCFPSFKALAALGEREGVLVSSLLGRPPADASCVAERLERNIHCFKGRRVLSGKPLEDYIRLLDYLYAKVPNSMIIELRKEVLKGKLEILEFDYPCFYEFSRDAQALRQKGPKDFRIGMKPCKGDLTEVLKRIGVELGGDESSADSLHYSSSDV
ncbi:hypothetical protein IPA_09685 [Ignicoccus pacificus DSM 13166]|uniref:Uncharacterized protein n=1 Tax=Ignicoccus pacificus DSM 13166 TaxID=940294 RepID=A0A977KD67_9CREN|nr:hypothetical protein IPA_09685 [Ignicoccus pacificus DSM 13166]